MSESRYKFRAWDKINSKWVSVADLDEEIIINPFTSTSRAGQFSISEWNAVHRVAEDIGTTIVLMQFTGLLDKNGVEIYEGDWLRTHRCNNSEDQINGYVIFESGSFSIAKWKSMPLRDIFIAGDIFEVIGNIHQHPELLEVD